MYEIEEKRLWNPPSQRPRLRFHSKPSRHLHCSLTHLECVGHLGKVNPQLGSVKSEGDFIYYILIKWQIIRKIHLAKVFAI